jgi:transcriptional regulator with XRE-family HTH domain
LTQERLAAVAGLTVRTVQRIEKDEHAPTLATLTALAGALDCSVGDLLGAAA